MDDSDDESFVTIGTALPPYESDEIPSKPVAIQDQVVKDSQGRVRFHGAFTGGFSAGYYNTVGSAEGWAPSTFVSSRGQRASSSLQKPEDFMDQEDLGEHGIAPRMVSTTDKFTSAENQRKRQPDVVTDDLLQRHLVVPSSIPMGIRLLRKLGWREGQGVGPRVKKRNQKNINGKKMYGCAMPPVDSDGEPSEESDVEGYTEEVTFAPKDVALIDFKSKDDLHGIGYSGIDPNTATGHFVLFEDPNATGFGQKKGIRGHAFGTGALEDEDEDVYALDHLSRYDRELPTLTEEMSSQRNHHNKHQSVRGHGFFEGFKLSSAPVLPKKVYPPLPLPRDFKPHHVFPRQPKDCLPFADAEVKTCSNEHKLDASERRQILGELPQIKSVMDLISDKDKARLSSHKTNTLSHMAPPSGQDTATPLSASTTATITHPIVTTTTASTVSVSESTAAEAAAVSVRSAVYSSSLSFASPTACQKLGHFKPFAKNPAKQARYELYLQQSQKSASSGVTLPCEGMTEWEIEKEREEFARAAVLYRPLSSLMASRFTTARHSDDDNHVQASDPKTAVSEQKKAADMKMFGKLTRELLEWHPDRVLCKRFNVPNPYPDSSTVGLLSSKRDKISVYNFLDFAGTRQPEVKAEEAPRPRDEPQATKGSKVKLKPLAILAEVDLQVKPPSDPQGEPNSSTPDVSDSKTIEISDAFPVKPPSETRPPMDLFKAIFAESSESSSDESESETPDVVPSKTDSQVVNNQPATKPSASHQSAGQENSRHDSARSQSSQDIKNSNEPVNIFSHLFETKTDNANMATKTSMNTEMMAAQVQMSSDSSEEEFGPAPPPNMSAYAPPTHDRGHVHKKHKKHSHKSKKKKHKSKSKKHKKKSK